MHTASDGKICVTGDANETESGTKRRLFLKGILPNPKPTVTITLKTAPTVRISASRTQRIVV